MDDEIIEGMLEWLCEQSTIIEARLGDNRRIYIDGSFDAKQFIGLMRMLTASKKPEDR